MIFSFQDDVRGLNWSEVHQSLEDLGSVKRVLSVMDVILSIPPDSVKVEEDILARYQAGKKRIAQRGSSTMSDWMVVFRETPRVKFYNPDKDVQLWMADGMKVVEQKIEILDDQETVSNDESEVYIMDSSDEEQEQQTKRKRKSPMKPREKSDVVVSKCPSCEINPNESAVLSHGQINCGQC